MNWSIPLSDIDFGPEESAAVQEVLQSRWLTMGAVTQKFEQTFAEYVGVKHAIAVTNATAALHLACVAAGLGPGDEAIVPSLTFVATANAVRYTGARPIFADVASENDLNISCDSIKKLITPRTKAILVVHYAGYPCDMPQIMALAKDRQIKVIEDAAHAIGSELDGCMLGNWGDMGCFSFFSNKNMTTGEGGMLVTNDDQAAENVSRMRSHGMTSLTWDRHKGHAWSYDVLDVGYNYRIDEIRAALGLVQMGKLIVNNQRRRELTRLYRTLIHQMVPEIAVPFENAPGISAAHIFPVLLPGSVNRYEIMESLKKHGIQTSIHYTPIHKFTAFRQMTESVPQALVVTEEVAAREMTLPLFPAMTDQDVLTVVQALQGALLELH
jgi:dTDP-4-amino-4,6-dideoxygalactose transaminase